MVKEVVRVRVMESWMGVAVLALFLAVLVSGLASAQSPEVQILAPLNGSVYANQSVVYITVNIANSTVTDAYCEVYENGTYIQLVTLTQDTQTGLWTGYVQLDVGDYLLNVTAYNASATLVGYNTTNVSVVAPTAVPVSSQVQVISPEDGASLAQYSTLVVNATSGVGSYGEAYVYNETNLFVERLVLSNVSGYFVGYSPSALSQTGVKTILIAMYDSNMALVGYNRTTVTVEPLSVTFVSPTQTYSDNYVAVRVYLTPGGSYNVSASVDGGSAQYLSSPDGYNYSGAGFVVADGTHTLTVTVFDQIYGTLLAVATQNFEVNHTVQGTVTAHGATVPAQPTHNVYVYTGRDDNVTVLVWATVTPAANISIIHPNVSVDATAFGGGVIFNATPYFDGTNVSAVVKIPISSLSLQNGSVVELPVKIDFANGTNVLFSATLENVRLIYNYEPSELFGFGGNTTMWRDIADPSNVTSLVFEKVDSSGKPVARINIMGDTVPINLLNDSFVDVLGYLGTFITLSNSTVAMELTGSALSELNTTTEITFYGLGNIPNIYYTSSTGETKEIFNASTGYVDNAYIIGSPEYFTNGTFRFTVRHWSSYSIDQLPVPVATFPDKIYYKYLLTYDASQSYDPDGSIVKYLWDFGDGSTAEGKVVMHAYESPGTYTLRLTVVDSSGLSSSREYTVNVLTMPPDEMEFGPDYSGIHVSSDVSYYSDSKALVGDLVENDVNSYTKEKTGVVKVAFYMPESAYYILEVVPKDIGNVSVGFKPISAFEITIKDRVEEGKTYNSAEGYLIFRVSKKWFEENNLSIDSIKAVLLGSEDRELKVSLQSENDGWYYFKIETPAFGTFVVGYTEQEDKVVKAEETPAPAPTATPTPEITNTQSPEESPTPATTVVKSEQETVSNQIKKSPGFTVLAALAVLLLSSRLRKY